MNKLWFDVGERQYKNGNVQYELYIRHGPRGKAINKRVCTFDEEELAKQVRAELNCFIQKWKEDLLSPEREKARNALRTLALWAVGIPVGGLWIVFCFALWVWFTKLLLAV